MLAVVQQNFKLAGTGSYLPQHAISAEELDARAGWTIGWCRKHTGVVNRFECRTPESMISMGCAAISAAMLDANCEWSEVDAIIDCSTSQYRPIPCNAAHFQQELIKQHPDCHGIPCFDIKSTCLGSIIALNMINAMFATQAYRNIVLVASESGFSGVNFQQPESAGLIGDGAAAVVLTAAQQDNPIFFSHQSYAQHLDLCKVEGGGHKLPVFEYSDERKSDFQFCMDGPAVFRTALSYLKPMVTELRQQVSSISSAHSVSNIHYLPHQASPNALRAVRCQLKIPQTHFHTAVHEVGNMVSASIPYMLDRTRKQGLIASGDSIMLLGTSAGYSQAGLIFKL